MIDIEKIDNELYKTIHIEKDRNKFLKLWKEIKQDINLLKEVITPCKDKFNQYDTVKGITICEQILYDYKSVNKEIYQKLINLIYTNKDIARTVINGASNGGYSFLLISLFNFDLNLTKTQKQFAVNEAMNKMGTTYWKENLDAFSKKLDDMGISDENKIYMDFDGSINPIGEKTGIKYMNHMFSALGKEQAHGTGEFDIRYYILRNPNWTLEEKQQLIMDFWASDDSYELFLEQWEWGIVNDEANLKNSLISPMETFMLYKYTYKGLHNFYRDKDTTDRIWDEIQFCKQMHKLRPIRQEIEVKAKTKIKN